MRAGGKGCSILCCTTSRTPAAAFRKFLRAIDRAFLEASSGWLRTRVELLRGGWRARDERVHPLAPPLFPPEEHLPEAPLQRGSAVWVHARDGIGVQQVLQDAIEQGVVRGELSGQVFEPRVAQILLCQQTLHKIPAQRVHHDSSRCLCYLRPYPRHA